MSNAWWQLVVLFLAGIFSGVSNVLAGGGSLVTMPLLIFLGLDAAAANGTNRLAIAIQNLFAIGGFRKLGVHDWRFGMMLFLPALPGVLLGVFTAVSIQDLLFRRVLSVIMVLVLLLIITKRTPVGGSAAVASLTVRRKLSAMAAFALIGFYSGFIQAGVGFIVIAAMLWTTGLDLVRINALKVFVIGLSTLVATVMFAMTGNIVWRLGLVLAAGNAIGGWLGSYVAVHGGERWIKRMLVVAVLALALKLSGLYNVFTGLLP
ncbi:sulfite exporter TauE/SafE family protein [bacterium]|nr:sulfite exporter TauE/SafE family protein [candidate division CSSED10-310 bacterium]